MKQKGKKIVWTNGCFDILHPGHIHTLREAKKNGPVLIVGVNSDTSIRRLKGTERPILNQDERGELLSAISDVDYVIFFDDDTPLKIIEKLIPDVIVKGEDYHNREVVGREVVEKNGGHVVLIPFKEKISTTAIIKRIKEKENHSP